MNEVIALKKTNTIPDDPASLTSPEFKAEPTCPDVDVVDTSTRMANSRYVKNRLYNDTSFLAKKISDLDLKASSYDSIDIDSMTENVKTEISKNLDTDILGKLSNSSIKISYDDIKVIQEGTIKIIDDMLDGFNELTDLQAKSMEIYKIELQNRKRQLIIYYNDLTTAYQDCINGNIQYTAFNNKFTIWYNYLTNVQAYCQTVVRKLNAYLIGLKADATQQAIFNALTNNGQSQGIFLAEDDNGVMQLYINGQYMEMKGLKVLDVNNNATFAVGSDGSVTINATAFTVKGRSINTLVSEAMGSSDVIKDAVSNATNVIVSKLDEIRRKIDDSNSTMDKVATTVKDSIRDNIITSSEQGTLAALFADLQSRQDAVLKEVDTVLNLDNIKDSDKIKLNTYKTTFVNSFDVMKQKFEDTQSVNATVSMFTIFNDAMKKWNNDVGLARAFCKTVQANIIELSQAQTLNREQIFNLLTNNGLDQGIFMLENQLYINGEYIVGNDFNASNSLITPNLYTEDIYSNSVLSQVTQDMTIYVDSTRGNDNAPLRDNAVYKTLQGAIDAIPNMICCTITIQLSADTDGNVIIDGKFGGGIHIAMMYYNIFGYLQYSNCTTFLSIYGSQQYKEDDVEIYSRPAISPYNLIQTAEGMNASVYCYNSAVLFMRDVAVYNKIATEDTVYTDASSNYAVVAESNSFVRCLGCSILYSDNGFYSSASEMVLQDIDGHPTIYGHYLTRGGQIQCVRNVKNTYVNGGTYHYAVRDFETLKIGSKLTPSVFQWYDKNTVRPSGAIGSNTVRLESIGSTSFILGTTTRYDSNIKVGPDGDGTHICSPFWFFGTKFDQFINSNKTITNITLTFGRKMYAPNAELSFNLKLRYHKYSNLDTIYFDTGSDGTGVNDLLESNQPLKLMSDVLEVVYVKELNMNEPSAIIPLSQSSVNTINKAIKNGTCKGFCFYQDDLDSTCEFTKDLTVTIIYKES